MNRTLATLKQSDIFSDCTDDQIRAVAPLCTEQKHGAGELIFDEHSRSNELFIIAKGEVEISVNPSLVSARENQNLEPVALVTLRRGQSFGEISLLDQGLRSAAAWAKSENTCLLKIPREDLLELCEMDPHIGYILMRNLAADLAFKVRTTDLIVREALL